MASGENEKALKFSVRGYRLSNSDTCEICFRHMQKSWFSQRQAAQLFSVRLAFRNLPRAIRIAPVRDGCLILHPMLCAYEIRKQGITDENIYAPIFPLN